MEATAGRDKEGWFQVEGTACAEPVEGAGDVNTWGTERRYTGDALQIRALETYSILLTNVTPIHLIFKKQKGD